MFLSQAFSIHLVTLILLFLVLQKIRTPRLSKLSDERTEREARCISFFSQTMIENKAGSSSGTKQLIEIKYNNYCYYMSLLSTIIIIKLAMCKLPQKLAKSSCRIIAKTLWSVAFHWSSVLAPSIVKCRSIPLTQISINTSIDTQSRLDLCLTDISMDTQSTVYH